MKDSVIVLIGGCEDLTGKKEILSELVRLAGGKKARLVTIVAATCRPERVEQVYTEAFQSLGVARHVIGFNRSPRSVGHELLKEIERATCIFFAGGDQVRAMNQLVAHQLHDVLSRRSTEGVIMAGTSAGAVLMAETMITGRPCEVIARPRAVQLRPGIGLVPNVLIDSHFSQRRRFGRLAGAVTRYPLCLGIGIDENTAVILRGTSAEVLGTGTVTLIDGREIGYSDISGGRKDKPITVTDLKVHLIGSHHCFTIERGKGLDARKCVGESI